jgi:acetyl esterase/lipase
MALIAGSVASADPSGGSDFAFPSKERFPLWPGKPPGNIAKPITPIWSRDNGNRELWVRGVPFPEVHVYRPARPDGSSLLVFPGGGYEFLSVENEGLDAARRFNAERTTVFILAYRLPPEGWSERSLVALQDAQRAMRAIRSRAGAFAIDPARLGVLGFSAGGHLAADLAVSHSEQVYEPCDAADGQSACPAYVGLIYPVISLDTAVSTGVSSPNLLGRDPSAQLVAARSPALHVTADTPPSFIAAAADDPIATAGNSAAWIDSCRRAKASVEAHLFAQGGHGFGLHLPKDLPGSRWPDLFALWMRKHCG